MPARVNPQRSRTTVAPSAESDSWDVTSGCRASSSRTARADGAGAAAVDHAQLVASGERGGVDERADRLAGLLRRAPAHVELDGDVRRRRRADRDGRLGRRVALRPSRSGRSRASGTRTRRPPRPSDDRLVPHDLGDRAADAERRGDDGVARGASGAVTSSGSSAARERAPGSRRRARTRRRGAGRARAPRAARGVEAARRSRSRGGRRGSRRAARRAPRASRRAPARPPRARARAPARAGRGRARSPPRARPTRASARARAAPSRRARARRALALLGRVAPRPPPPRRAAPRAPALGRDAAARGLDDVGRRARGARRCAGRARRPAARARAVERLVASRVEAGRRVGGAVGRARPLLQLGVVASSRP